MRAPALIRRTRIAAETPRGDGRQIAARDEIHYHSHTFPIRIRRVNRPAILAILLLSGFAAHAGEVPEFHLAIQGHAFQPAELKVPAGTKFKLVVENRDTAPEEFESTEFGREKIVLPNSTADVFIGPLKPGSYRFFGDFHQDTAQGRLIVE